MIDCDIVLIQCQQPEFVAAYALSVVVIIPSDGGDARYQFTQYSVFRFFVCEGESTFCLQVSAGIIGFHLVSVEFEYHGLVSRFGGSDIGPPGKI